MQYIVSKRMELWPKKNCGIICKVTHIGRLIAIQCLVKITPHEKRVKERSLRNPLYQPVTLN